MRSTFGDVLQPIRRGCPTASGGTRRSRRPGGSARGQLRTLSFEPLGGADRRRAVIRVEYRLHTYNRMQREQDEYRFWQTVAAAVLLPTTLFAMILVVRFLQRERQRELDRWRRRSGGRTRTAAAQVERALSKF